MAQDDAARGRGEPHDEELAKTDGVPAAGTGRHRRRIWLDLLAIACLVATAIGGVQAMHVFWRIYPTRPGELPARAEVAGELAGLKAAVRTRLGLAASPGRARAIEAERSASSRRGPGATATSHSSTGASVLSATTTDTATSGATAAGARAVVPEARPATTTTTKPAPAATTRSAPAGARQQEAVLSPPTASEKDQRAAYVRGIKSAVERHWRRPPGSAPGLQCTVAVEQAPGGGVVRVQITHGSGNAAFDHSVVAAVRHASPLPAPAAPSLFAREVTLVFGTPGGTKHSPGHGTLQHPVVASSGGGSATGTTRGTATPAPQPAPVAASVRRPAPHKNTAPPPVSPVTSLLAQADALFARDRLTTPAGANAFERYGAVLAQDPGNADAREGLHRIAARYLHLARRAASTGDRKKALLYIGRGLGVVPGQAGLVALRKEIKARVASGSEPGGNASRTGPGKASSVQAARASATPGARADATNNTTSEPGGNASRTGPGKASSVQAARASAAPGMRADTTSKPTPHPATLVVTAPGGKVLALRETVAAGVYRVFVDGDEKGVMKGADHQLHIRLRPGSHRLRVVYESSVHGFLGALLQPKIFLQRQLALKAGSSRTLTLPPLPLDFTADREGVIAGSPWHRLAQ